MNWEEALDPQTCSYVFGNPPFRGHQFRDKDQQQDMHLVWGQSGQVNRLDYVTCWFHKATEYMLKNPKIKVGFVATNSISQGEQASILWAWMYPKNVRAFFAHRTFQWQSEAAGRAAVHCVVLGLMIGDPDQCSIFDYPDVRSEPVVAKATRINAYLINAPHVLVPARTKSPYGYPSLFQGSKPADGARLKKPEGGYVTTSNLILDPEEHEKALARSPEIKKWLRPYIGGKELLSGEIRWCLWLKDITPHEIKASAEIQNRLDRVRHGRLKSPTASVREFAETPWLFTQDRQPNSEYLAIPEVSSETREYIPMAILPPETVGSNKLLIMPDAEPWIFALLTSAMHMGWMRTVSGRLESRYSYAPTIYNSFPWPELTDKHKADLEKSAQAINTARAKYKDTPLGVLYEPDVMPADLRKVHTANDKLVDRIYRKGGFNSERERVEHLFQLFVERAAPLEAGGKSKGS